MRVTQKGTFREFGNVWLHPSASCNILSQSAVNHHCRVSLDRSDDSFKVTPQDGPTYTFANRDGRYTCDLDEDVEESDYAEPQYGNVHYSRSLSGGAQPWTCY